MRLRLRDYIQARPTLRYWCSVRWPIANALNRLDSQCWSDLVPWALGWRKDDPWPDNLPFVGGGERCRIDSFRNRDGWCYCGKFVAGRRYVDPERPSRLARLLHRLHRRRCRLCRALMERGSRWRYCPRHTNVQVTQMEEMRR